MVGFGNRSMNGDYHKAVSNYFESRKILIVGNPGPPNLMDIFLHSGATHGTIITAAGRTSPYDSGVRAGNFVAGEFHRSILEYLGESGPSLVDALTDRISQSARAVGLGVRICQWHMDRESEVLKCSK